MSMNEKPIIFSGEMVRAILEGRKTQTRRVVKFSAVDKTRLLENEHQLWKSVGQAKDGSYIFWDSLAMGERTAEYYNGGGYVCPKGKAGDRLWVRESFRELIDLGASTNSSSNYYEYKADDLPDYNPDVKWGSPIYMPREASRITLEIVKIRVERLQDITPDDVLAEGIKKTEVDDYWLAPLAGVPDYPWGRADLAYAALWNELNKKRVYRWEDDPFVWVIEFKKVKR